MLARRAADTNGWHHGSAAASSEEWLAGASGCSEFQARDALQTAKRIDELPATAEKFRDGTLSMSRASLIAKAAEADPDAESRLLQAAQREGLRTLRDKADRVVAAATDETEAHAKARRERHLRTWRVGMATHGSFSGPTQAVDVLLRALKPLEQARFDQARKDDGQPRESYDARCFDALIDLACNEGGGTSASAPVARVRVDLSALLAGRTSPGEICEIPGVGPVPVEHARTILSHGLLELVITDGVDVQTVVSKTRHLPEALRVAVDERDGRCKIRGCDTTHGLERHHTLAFAEHHRTTYDLIGSICRDHHDKVTHGHHAITDHRDGTWSLQPPDEPGEQRDTHAA
jgi:hypothetical protein